MSIEQVEEGDYVRVVLEGKVEESYSDSFYLEYGDGGRQPYVPVGHDAVKSVEKIPEPEDWQVGDIVRSDSAWLYQRTTDGWNFLNGSRAHEAQHRTDKEPYRPLTLLVRNGQVVTK